MTQVQHNSDVRIEFLVEAPPGKAYEVFTAGIGSWWPRTHHLGTGTLAEVIVEPQVGGRLVNRETDGTECPWGTVLIWSPPGHFAFSWDISLDWKHQPDRARTSRVDITFSAAGPDRTRVTLVHSGLENHGDGWESMRAAVADPNGWPAIQDLYGKAVAA
ncbi:SRPBCC family protein [Nocardia sp. NEAU-G5]|uniref:SRPBCC family protein n=1 Tax=Nocardia albiluteola TaxID=2842303 RepID=A0ABS6B5X0_9NOCA|nr:SRPBCC family protein [Nocardia albiluteola]MBU3064735.1 SRPBCC family protein [Nocardia albiluteola]